MWEETKITASCTQRSAHSGVNHRFVAVEKQQCLPPCHCVAAKPFYLSTHVFFLFQFQNNYSVVRNNVKVMKMYIKNRSNHRLPLAVNVQLQKPQGNSHIKHTEWNYEQNYIYWFWKCKLKEVNYFNLLVAVWNLLVH